MEEFHQFLINGTSEDSSFKLDAVLLQLWEEVEIVMFEQEVNL